MAKVPREFIFNVDETGCDEFVDSKNVPVLVPTAHKGDHVDIPINRQSKRATLTACIAADGSALKPFVILPRETIDEDIYRAGYTPDKVVFYHHMHAFMTKKLFELWMTTVFIPDLQQRRERMNYRGRAILIMDQFSGHRYENLGAQCSDNNIFIKYLVPHTSHLCQPLDLVTFAMLKRHLNANKPRQGRSKQSNKIIKMLHSWQQSIAIDTTISTFSAAGIVSKRGYLNQMFYCSVDLSLSIHLTELDNLIGMQEETTKYETPGVIDGPHNTTDASAGLLQFRPTLYPPNASWVQDKQIRIPIAVPSEQTESPKKTPKNSQQTTLVMVHPAGLAIPPPQRQLTLSQAGWTKLKIPKPGASIPDASSHEALHLIAPQQDEVPKTSTSAVACDDADFLS
jgi:hypothetical protein